MTVEEKAKAYDIIIQRVTELYETGTTLTKEQMEHLFPELRESEDERIRKGIIDGMKCIQDRGRILFYGMPINDVIAWLEKQKEQKHYWKPTETDAALFNKAVTTNKALTPAERAQLDIIRSKFGYCRTVNCSGIVQEEQKPETFNESYNPDEYEVVVEGNTTSLKRKIKDVVKDITKNKESAINFLKSAGIMDDNGELAEMYRSEEKLEKRKESEDKGEISDGYHTFNELYYYRMLYNAAFFNLLPKEWVHKSKKHHDGEECFGGGWFIVIANLPTGQISNHYELKDWDLFQIPEKEIADEWDGHTPQEAAERLHKYLQEEQKPSMIQWTGKNLKEVIDFTGKSQKFGEWFKSWEDYENYVHSHRDIFKLFRSDGSHYEVPVGAWIIKTPDGYNIPSQFKFVQKSLWSEEDEKIRKALIAFLEVNTGYFSCNGFTKDDIIQWLKSLSPQPKAEWNEEDEDKIEHIVGSLESLKKYTHENTGMSEEYKEHIFRRLEQEQSWLKSLHPVKQEWSEEDERMLERAIHIIVEYSDIDEKESEIVQNWLKSIRSSWKLNEEQMDRLFSIVAALRKDYCDDMADFLASLYKQLKKL